MVHQLGADHPALEVGREELSVINDPVHRSIAEHRQTTAKWNAHPPSGQQFSTGQVGIGASDLKGCAPSILSEDAPQDMTFPCPKGDVN